VIRRPFSSVYRQGAEDFDGVFWAGRHGTSVQGTGVCVPGLTVGGHYSDQVGGSDFLAFNAVGLTLGISHMTRPQNCPVKGRRTLNGTPGACSSDTPVFHHESKAKLPQLTVHWRASTIIRWLPSSGACRCGCLRRHRRSFQWSPVSRRCSRRR